MAAMATKGVNKRTWLFQLCVYANMLWLVLCFVVVVIVLVVVAVIVFVSTPLSRYVCGSEVM